MPGWTIVIVGMDGIPRPLMTTGMEQGSIQNLTDKVLEMNERFPDNVPHSLVMTFDPTLVC